VIMSHMLTGVSAASAAESAPTAKERAKRTAFSVTKDPVRAVMAAERFKNPTHLPQSHYYISLQPLQTRAQAGLFLALESP
jgi:hypothetical protein